MSASATAAKANPPSLSGLGAALRRPWCRVGGSFANRNQNPVILVDSIVGLKNGSPKQDTSPAPVGRLSANRVFVDIGSFDDIPTMLSLVSGPVPRPRDFETRPGRTPTALLSWEVQ
jgi:hypothetical protein